MESQAEFFANLRRQIELAEARGLSAGGVGRDLMRLGAAIALAADGPEAALERLGAIMAEVDARFPEAWPAVAERASFPVTHGNA